MPSKLVTLVRAGPCGIRNRWSSAGTSGHNRHARIAGSTAFNVPTSASEAASGWVRIPPPHPLLELLN